MVDFYFVIATLFSFTFACLICFLFFLLRTRLLTMSLNKLCDLNLNFASEKKFALKSSSNGKNCVCVRGMPMPNIKE